MCLEQEWSNLCKIIIEIRRYDGDDGDDGDGGGKTKTLSSHHLLPTGLVWSGMWRL